MYVYKSDHENEKITKYLPPLPRVVVLQVEETKFTPVVFSTSGGIGGKADKLIRLIAERMSAKRQKRGDSYISVVSLLRRKIRFYLLKTCIIALH